jgi:hypothetical protein
MASKKGWLISLATVVTILMALTVLLFSGVTWARPLAQSPETITIPYPGRLTDEAGRAVEGVCDFSFAIYDAATEGNLLWSEMQSGVSVQAGSLITVLGSRQPIPAAMMEGGERWLEVAVRGPGQADLVTMSPRQQLRADAAPDASIQAGAPCPHDHWGETWTSTGPGLTLSLQGGAASVSLISLFSALYASHDVLVAVMGVSDASGVGVWGQSRDNYGVFGTSVNGSGGFFTSNQDHFDIGLGGEVGRINAAETATSQLYLSANGDIILKLDNDGGGDNILRVQNSGGTNVCIIDEAGNLTCTGGKSAVVETSDYGWRKLYAVEGPEIRFEDIGSTTLVEGEVAVAFEPIFAQTINGEAEYQVFLTVVGDEPVLLYVASKTAAGFTVKGVTLDGQPANCSFDYRIVAHRLGYEDVRLEQVDWQAKEVTP